jgi:hypothetical protein
VRVKQQTALNFRQITAQLAISLHRRRGALRGSSGYTKTFCRSSVVHDPSAKLFLRRQAREKPSPMCLSWQARYSMTALWNGNCLADGFRQGPQPRAASVGCRNMAWGSVAIGKLPIQRLLVEGFSIGRNMIIGVFLSKTSLKWI